MTGKVRSRKAVQAGRKLLTEGKSLLAFTGRPHTSGLHRLTRRHLPSHDVRLDLIGRDPHGIKIENFTSPMERYL